MGEKNLLKLCAELEPIMASAIYVYCSFSDFRLPAGIAPLATVREAEGLTAIIELDEADRLAISYTFPARLITLSVHSSLEAVGLLAVISSHLAHFQIPCNVIAGFYHDHILIPVERAEEAMIRLSELPTQTI